MRRGAALLVVALALGSTLGACGPPKKGVLVSTFFGPPMPAERTEVAGTYWEDEGLIAVAGGFASNGQATNNLFLFNRTSNTWSSGTPLPGNYDHASLAFLDAKIWLVGGNKNGAPTNEVWSLDSPNAAWQSQPSMSTPRGALATVAATGKLVAIGGFNGVTQLASSEFFDPVVGVWSAGPSMAIPREHLGAAAFGNVVLAIGGRPPNTASVEGMVIGSSGFAQGAPLQFSRGGNGATYAGGMPCTAGGEEAAGTIGLVECLAQVGWARYANMRQPRHGLAVVGVGSQIHLIAGGPSPGLTVSATHEIVPLNFVF